MSDRLDELKRQRELQKERLEWLDREIASLESQPPKLQEEGAPEAAGAAPDPALEGAEAILQEYRRHPADISRRTRYGCLLYFAALMAVLAILAAYFYLRVRSGRTHP